LKLTFQWRPGMAALVSTSPRAQATRAQAREKDEREFLCVTRRVLDNKV